MNAFGEQPKNKQLVAWVAECVEGTASDATWNQLDALLKTDESARHYYLAQMHLHATLMRRLPAPEIVLPDLETALVPRASAADDSAIRPLQQKRLAVLRTKLQQGIQRLGQPTPFAVFVAAASLLLMLIAFAAIPVSFEAANRPHAAPPADTETFVAEVVETSRPQWAGDMDFRRGDRLHVGQVLALRTGMVSLRFDRGARVVVEGPAKIRITSDNAAGLLHGRLTAHVPPKAVGYEVAVKQMTITDLGTQFGVVAGEGATQVHVFRGSVSVGPADGSTVEPHVLLAGAAGEFNDRGQLTGDYVASDDTFRHASRLAGADTVQVRGSLRYLISPPSSLAAGGPLENDRVAHLLLERENVVLAEPVSALLVEPDNGRQAKLRAGQLARGTALDCYLIHFDIKSTADGRIIQRTGLVEFDRPILAVLVADDDLAATDRTLGLPDVVYDTESGPRRTRGFEPGDYDQLAISGDRRKLQITCGLGSDSTDQVRVLLAPQQP